MNRRIKILLFFFFCLFLTNHLASQDNYGTRKTQIIRGRVADKSSEAPIIGATIVVIDSTQPHVQGTTSDTDGYYVLENVSVGRVSIQVSCIGYIPVKIENILLKSAKELLLNIELEESAIQMKEVAVVLRKDEPINAMAVASARAFTIEETERFAGSWGDPARMATNYAGVFTAGDQRNDIIIRGNSPTGLLWQLEDIPIPSPNHFDVLGTTGGPISILNNNLLTRSDFFTSAFPAEYGNAASGVFDLKMRNGNYEKHEFLFQCGFNGFEGGAEGPISRESKSSYIMNVRYSMLGLMQDLLWVDGMPQYKDVSFKLNFPLSSGKFSIFGLGGISTITMVEDDPSRSRDAYEYATKNMSGSETGVLALQYLHNFGPETSLKTSMAWSTRRPHELIDSTLNENVYLNLDNNSFRQDEITLTSRLVKTFDVMNTVSLGVVVQDMSFDAKRQTSDYDGYLNKLTIDEPYSITNRGMILSQLFFQWKHSFTDLLSFNAGVHVLHFHFNSTSAADPRIGLSWQFAENQSVGVAYGLHSQIQPLNVYLIRSKIGLDANSKQMYADLGTNKNLGFTKSNQFVVSHNYSFDTDIRLKTEAYYQFLFNVPVKPSKGYFSMINAGAAMSVPEEDSLTSTGYGKNYGIECTLEKFLSQHYYFLITSSLFNSLYRGSDGVWRNTTYSGGFVFNILGGYELDIKENILLSSNLRLVYAGGRRIIPYDLAKSIAENDTRYLYDQAYEKQVKNYFRMDLRIGAVFQGEKATHELAIDIVNVTNHKNVFRERYDNATKKPKISYQQGIFPMGLYRINF